MQITIVILILICAYLFYRSRTIEQKTKEIYSKKLDITKAQNDLLESMQVDATKVVNMTEHTRIITEERRKYNFLLDDYEETQTKLLQEKEKNAKILSQKKSSEVRTGQISEQLMPLLEKFPYDAKKLRGIFNPIDYIYFGQEEIVFLEFKSGGSKLSSKQKNIKRLVEEKKVKFETFRLDEEGLHEEE